MKRTLLVFALLAASVTFGSALLSAMPIYGSNDYVPASSYPAGDPLAPLADATVAFFRSMDIAGDGHVRARTMGELYDLCKDEPFYASPTVSFCSGVLIGSDSVLTAAHCLKPGCENMKIVFGYTSKSPDFTLPADNVYSCVSAVAGPQELPDGDIAVVKLDRPVAGRKPVPISNAKPEAGMSLVSIGHPKGMPRLAQPKVKVIMAAEGYDFFTTDMDSFGGQSGSPVFDSSGKVLGVHFSAIGSASGDNITLDIKNECYRATPLPDGEWVDRSKLPQGAKYDAITLADTAGNQSVPVASMAVSARAALKKYIAPQFSGGSPLSVAKTSRPEMRAKASSAPKFD